jgi:hypothetical protein
MAGWSIIAAMASIMKGREAARQGRDNVASMSTLISLHAFQINLAMYVYQIKADNFWHNW